MCSEAAVGVSNKRMSDDTLSLERTMCHVDAGKRA